MSRFVWRAQRMGVRVIACMVLLTWSSTAVIGATSEVGADTELEEVQVTGTRIQSPGVESANPITSITSEELQALGLVNIADAITQLVPQNVSTYTDFAVADLRDSSNDGSDRSTYFIGNTIANLRGLDPAFGSRTLTMVDGRRVVSTSNLADVVDLNIIPSNLLQRMDVVTGGASATYGSGAIAGVVNLVLNNRFSGVNLDVDYGVNEVGDGGSPHFAFSAGAPLFDGRAHALLGVEWQRISPIQNCAEARDWCAQSRTLFDNSTTGLFNIDPSAVLTTQVPGFADRPARFQQRNVRYSQFSSNGVILVTSQPNATSAYRFTDDGTGVDEYALGFRGGNGGGNVVNGDGPLATSGTSMRSGNERRTLFTNFEFNFSERLTGYLQANYAKTRGENRNTYTISTSCVRFDTPGVAALPGASLVGGSVVPVPTSTNIANTPWVNANFRAFLGLTAPPFIGTSPNNAPPYYYLQSSTPVPGQPPTFNFGGNAEGTWQLIPNGANSLWRLISVRITNPAGFNDPGTPVVLPNLGRNAYAFLADLDPEALDQVRRAFGNSNTSGVGPEYLVGSSPCAGNTAIRKVWSPQFQRFTVNQAETASVLGGLRGRIAGDWRWEAYYQYGQTDSLSTQNNAATTIRQYFALDAVIDDRAGSTTFGQPVCRVTRDGVPVLDTQGRPLSDPDALRNLAAGCQPLNIFGSSFADPVDAARQQAAIAYAFVQNDSAGRNSLHSAAATVSGTVWRGWGAGPLISALGLEARQDEVDNPGLLGSYYERFDINGGWSDRFGGRTRVIEGYSELNVPLVSGIEGMNLWSINGAIRRSRIDNQGGAGTTGESLTQETTNWKLSMLYEPFDWVRLRSTRSRDLRAAGYRDLFLNQPTARGPDAFTGANPWRDRTPESIENQLERWGKMQVGNPLLKPETSDALTLGLVLSPGGWAQGMRASADYYDIRVKNGIYVSYRNMDPISACWSESGNRPAGFDLAGNPDPAQPGINGLFDENNVACREIEFALNADGTRDLQDIVSFNDARPSNALPFRRRGVDVSLAYVFPLGNMIRNLPGSISLTLRGQRALESFGSENVSLSPALCRAGATLPCDVTVSYDLVGQISSSRYLPGVTASPKWTGNLIGTYALGRFATSLSARYVGGAKLDNTWSDSIDEPYFQNAAGQYLQGSVDDNHVGAYLNFSLNGSYDLAVSDLRQFQVFGSISNLFDKDPPWSGGYLSGASPQYHDTMGRAYRMGVRVKF